MDDAVKDDMKRLRVSWRRDDENTANDEVVGFKGKF